MAKKATATKREVETVINPYEIMLILNPELRESEIKKKLKEITEMIVKEGGKITNEDFWGKKDLAYRIKKHWEGIYMVYNLEPPNTFLNELKNYFRIEKDILRSIILTLPSDYTYTKYDLEAAAEEEKKEKRSFKKNVSIKHNAPVIPAKKLAPIKIEEEKVVEEKAKEIKEEKKPVSPVPSETEVTKAEGSEAEGGGEEKEEVKEKKVVKKEIKDVDEAELDKKLDEIIGGEDLNL